VGRVLLALVALLFCAVQPALALRLAIAGVQPDLPLVLTITVGMLLGPTEGTLAGFLCAFFQLPQGTLGGIGALLSSRTLAGFVAGQVGRRVFRVNVWAPFLALTAGTVGTQLAYFAVSPTQEFASWLASSAAQALYNGVLAVPIYLGFAALLGRHLPEPRVPV